MLMKRIIFLLAITACWHANATMVVHDPGIAVQNAVSETMNFAKYMQTEINTLNTYENQVVQLARMGNPAALRSLPGVSAIAELYQTYGAIQNTYARTQGLLNPNRYQYDMNSILSGYELPQWHGYTAANGLPVLPAQGLFQFNTGQWNLADNTLQQWQMLDDKRQRLQQQRDQAVSALQGATTQSDVQKYHAQIDALNGAIAEVTHEQQSLYQHTTLQRQQLEAGQRIYEGSVVEQRQMQTYQAVDAGLNGLPVGDMDRPALWGAKP